MIVCYLKPKLRARVVLLLLTILVNAMQSGRCRVTAFFHPTHLSIQSSPPILSPTLRSSLLFMAPSHWSFIRVGFFSCVLCIHCIGGLYLYIVFFYCFRSFCFFITRFFVSILSVFGTFQQYRHNLLCAVGAIHSVGWLCVFLTSWYRFYSIRNQMAYWFVPQQIFFLSLSFICCCFCDLRLFACVDTHKNVQFSHFIRFGACSVHVWFVYEWRGIDDSRLVQMTWMTRVSGWVSFEHTDVTHFIYAATLSMKVGQFVYDRPELLKHKYMYNISIKLEYVWTLMSVGRVQNCNYSLNLYQIFVNLYFLFKLSHTLRASHKTCFFSLSLSIFRQAKVSQ